MFGPCLAFYKPLNNGEVKQTTSYSLYDFITWNKESSKLQVPKLVLNVELSNKTWAGNCVFLDLFQFLMTLKNLSLKTKYQEINYGKPTFIS